MALTIHNSKFAFNSIVSILTKFTWVRHIVRAFHKRDFKRRYLNCEWYHFNENLCNSETRKRNVHSLPLSLSAQLKGSDSKSSGWGDTLASESYKIHLKMDSFFLLLCICVELTFMFFTIAVKWLYEVPMECIDKRTNKRKKKLAKSSTDSNWYCFRIKPAFSIVDGGDAVVRRFRWQRSYVKKSLIETLIKYSKHYYWVLWLRQISILFHFKRGMGTGLVQFFFSEKGKEHTHTQNWIRVFTES